MGYSARYHAASLAAVFLALAVGILIGVCLVTTAGPPALYLALTVLAALAIYGEFRSISAWIERVPLLQRLDSLGRAS